MFKRIIFVLILAVLLCSCLHAQSKNAEEIDRYCESINNSIVSEGESGNFYLVHTLRLESNVRAIGKQVTTIKYFYAQPSDSLVESDSETFVIDLYKPPVKITVDYNIAASQKISVEYYSDENGKLILYHYISKGEYTNGEEFYYFGKNNTPVKIKSSPLDRGKKVLYDFRNFDKTGDFGKEDLKNCEGVIKKFGEYNKMFFELIKTEKLDK